MEAEIKQMLKDGMGKKRIKRYFAEKNISISLHKLKEISEEL